jgi:hypothetical protein
MDWFSRHLNWTWVIGILVLNLVSFFVGDFARLILLATIPLTIWTLSQKGRSIWWIFLSWTFAPLWLPNKYQVKPTVEPVDSPTKESYTHIFDKPQIEKPKKDNSRKNIIVLGILFWCGIGIIVFGLFHLHSIGSFPFSKPKPEPILRVDETSKQWTIADINKLIYFLSRTYRDYNSSAPEIPRNEWDYYDILSGWEKVSQAKQMVSNVWFEIHMGEMDTLKERGVDYDFEEPYSSLWEAWFNSDLALSNATTYEEFVQAEANLYDSIYEMHKVISSY